MLTRWQTAWFNVAFAMSIGMVNAASQTLVSIEMRVLLAVQCLFAAALLLLGVVTTFAIGITGLIFFVAGAALAALASATATKSRTAVVMALAVDAAIATFAASKLKQLLTMSPAAQALNPQAARLLAPTTMDLLVPAATIALVVCAFVAVLLDWRNVRAARWF